MSTAPPASASSVRFLLDGELVTADVAPTTTVLEYLRDTLRRTGTKEGCAEGDCGACTVVLGELDPDLGRVAYKAVNSCIRFLPTIDGAELVTVESLRGSDGSLHPVQQAIVDHHASQCGFCTPGFVMSLFALYLRLEQPSREQVLEALSGNLCRCTGYRPLIEAGCRMGAYAPPTGWSRAQAASSERREALKALCRERALEVPGFCAPRSLDELAAAINERPEALVLAGGTDVGLWVTKQLRDLPPLIYIGEVAELKRVRRNGAAVVIGAAVSLADGWDAVVGEYAELGELAQRFGSPPVRNSGTLCGNLANGSPIGDSMPALIALEAELELRRGGVTRRLPLEDFYRGYQRKDLAPGEFLVSVSVPRRRPGLRLAGYKVSKRFDQDISAVCAGIALQVESGRVHGARIAFGGMAAIPARARAAERVLVGAAWDGETIERAAAALAADFQPLSDLRGGSAYRLQTAGNLLRRFHAEHGADAGPVRTAAATAAPA